MVIVKLVLPQADELSRLLTIATGRDVEVKVGES